MAFTLSAIQQAHQQFTGVDFPKLFKAYGYDVQYC